MSQHLKCLIAVMLICSGTARADSLDDFTNNLFTDLAPILALFGERVTMQFMSQALGWADCIALAMAPLGIITIIVSAIRVGGPMWLKAIIGRAKENMAIAETELMSSTSEEVCELYNGKSIVRCQGTAPVWEYICLFPSKGSPSRVRFMTLDQATKCGLLEEARESSRNSSLTLRNLCRGWTEQLGSPSSNIEANGERDDRLIVIKDTRPDSPNISLNLQNSHDRLSIRLVAATSVILQAAVLAFFGLMVYHPQIKNDFQREGKMVGDHSFPLATGGTILLVLGLLICGHVVESSTQEEQYKANSKFKMGIYWLQQNQKVADQVFKPYATFSHIPHSVITISRRNSALSNSASTNFLETRTVSGAIISIVGFILQFIGLRAMNSAATLAQLGAVLIMTICRALVRPGFPISFVKAKLLAGYEIDWLAWKLVVSDPSERFSDASKNNIDAAEEHASLGSWAIAVGGEQKSPPFGPPDTQLESEAQRLLTTSRGLYKLAGFHRSTTPIAINLALAIEATLNALFPPGENERTTYRWYLDIEFRVATAQEENGQHTEKIWFDLVNDGSSWRAPADCLNAAISLWTYTAQQRTRASAPVDAQERVPLEKDDNDGWLRSRLPPSGLRLLGPTNDRLVQDLKWWAPENSVFEVQEDVGNTADPGAKQETPEETSPKESDLKEGSDASARFKEIEKARVVGHGECTNNSDLDSNIWKISTIDWKVPVDEGAPASHQKSTETLATEGKSRSSLAIETTDPLEVLYAKDLLFSFWYSAAKTLRKPIRGSTSLRGSDAKVNSAADRSFSNDSLTKLVETCTALGFGTENEVLPSIVTPLSMTEMLPFPKIMFDLVSSEVVKPKDRLSGDHQVKALHALVQQASCHAYDSTGIWESCLALVAEAAHIFETNFKSDMWWSSYDTPLEEPDLFRRLLSFVPGDLLDTRLLTQLRTMYLKQGRQEMAVVSHGMTFDHSPYDLWLRATALHELAIRDPKNDPGSSAACHFELINEQDASNWTPLHYAAASGNLWFVELLGDSGASVDPELKDYRGYTALHCAFEEGNLEIIESLIDYGFRIDDQGFDGATPIHLAAKRGNNQALDCVFDDDWRHHRFDSARQQMKLAKRRQDANGRVPLHWAAMAGRAKSLAKSGDDINATDYMGRTPLHLAVIFDKPEVIRSLCDLSVDTDKTDHAFQTALYIACSENQLEAVKILLEAGANPEVPTDNGHRPLHVAAVCGYTSIMKELLEAKAEVLAICNDGATTLHEAARGPSPEATKLILEQGANPNAKTKKGETPIMHMLRQNSISREAKVLETLKCLVEGGANPSLEDKNGIKPLTVAREKGFSRVVEYLKSHKKE